MTRGICACFAPIATTVMGAPDDPDDGWVGMGSESGTHNAAISDPQCRARSVGFFGFGQIFGLGRNGQPAVSRCATIGP